MKVECDACGKIYANKQNLERHQETTCGKVDKRTKEFKNLLHIQQGSHSSIDASNKTINSNNTNTTIKNTINNTTTNNIAQQNIIVLNNFSKEDLDYITDKFKIKNLKLIESSGFEKMAKAIYFNDKHPENQTVKLPNKKEPYVKIHKDGKWDLKRKDEIFNNMITKIGDVFDEVLEEVVRNIRRIGLKTIENVINSRNL